MKSFVIQNTFQCHEPWHAMKGSSNARFCLNCEKIVIDYSRLSDLEISKILIEQGTLGCGRFHQSQLNREIFTEKPIVNHLTKFSLVALLAGNALMTEASTISDVKIVSEENLSLELSHFTKDSFLDEKYHIRISGKVFETDDSSQLIGAVVKVLEFPNIGTTTDFDGCYDFQIKTNDLLDSLTLEVSFISFKSVKRTIHLKEALNFEENFELEQDTTAIYSDFALSELVTGICMVTYPKHRLNHSFLKKVLFSPIRITRRFFRKMGWT